MRFQKYIFLSLITFFSCKTDVNPIVENQVITQNYTYPREITRENSSFGLYKVDEPNINVVFEKLSDDNDYKLYLSGVDTIQFHAILDCLNPLQKGDIIDSNLQYQQYGYVDFQMKSFSCTLIDTSYIGVKVKSSKYKYRANYGYLRIIQYLTGFWIIDKYVRNTAGHEAIKIED